jgi:valyl-tRNA synthetase
MIARTARMLGFETYFPIGIDRNGVPVERYTEKKFGIKMHETPREKFIELAATALDETEAYMIQILKAMGLSGDFENYYRTDSEEYRKLTQATFIQLWKRGLIYEDMRPNNYCKDCGTTLADADIVYEERDADLFYFKFKIKETGEDLIVASTRPELLCSCQAIIFNPNDERYKKLKGLHAITPLFEREVPIYEHPAAQPEFGTGVLMTCSYGDSEDVRLFRELQLKELVAIDENGKMTEAAGAYAGLPVKEARARIVEDMRKQGLLVKVEHVKTRVPICDRSLTEIEIIPMKEWYLKQLPFKKKLLQLQKKIKFHPEIHRQRLLDWTNAITIDWPISRRRFYGTEIPIWYCANGHPNVPKPGKYYRPWKEKAPFKKCKKCNSKEFIGDERTFDTWFDSSISPLFVTKFLRNKKFFKKVFPTTIRPQGKDIIRTWLYYTLLRCWQLTKKIPWKHAWIMGYGVDEKGEKMSKSKGNVIDPAPLLEKYGADTFRFWSASEASLGSDFRCSEQRIQNAGKFLTKLWNIARYISQFPKSKNAKLTATDKWILAELSKLIKDCRKGYEDFNFFIPATKIREFTWNIFADHYVEMCKARAYGEGFTQVEQESAWFTLHACLETILALLAPICPFITDFISRKIYDSQSIHTKPFPKTRWKITEAKLTQKILEFNSKIWEEKKKRGLSLRDEIEAEIPKELKVFEKDLKAMHNIV